MKWDLLCTNCRGAKLSAVGALRAAARRALPVLQHRLRPRLRAERRALLRAGAGGAAADGRRLLPRAARWRRRTSPVQLLLAPGERRTSTLDAAAGPLSPAHAASRRGRRRRASTAAPFPACARRRPASRRWPPGEAGTISLRQRRGLRAGRADRGPHLDARGADRARGDLAAGLPRPVRRGDPAAGRRGGGQPGGAAVHRPAAARRRSTSGSAMPRPSTSCASTSPSWPRSCATTTARWSRRSAMR